MESKSLTVRQLADLLSARLEGDGAACVTGVASLEEATPTQVTFVTEARHAPRLAQCKAGAVIVGDFDVQTTIPLLHVKNVQAAIALLLEHFGPGDDLPAAGIHPSAVISPGVKIGPGVAVGPNVTIGSGATIGGNSVLCANVSVGANVQIGEASILFEGVVVRWGCRVGNRVRIGPNSVIGFDGFGYYFDAGSHHRVPHVGQVAIEDDVEIGACTCVDRAKFGVTRIGAGTKMDNLVQVAHNVQVGKHCLMAAGVRVGGSVRLGNYVVLGGGASLRDNITLGDGVQASALAGVGSDIPAGQAIAGTPAGPAGDMLRQWHASTKLPELLKRVRELENRLNATESAKND